MWTGNGYGRGTQLQSHQKVRGDEMNSIPSFCRQIDFTQGDVIWFISPNHLPTSTDCDHNLGRLITWYGSVHHRRRRHQHDHDHDHDHDDHDDQIYDNQIPITVIVTSAILKSYLKIQIEFSIHIIWENNNQWSYNKTIHNYEIYFQILFNLICKLIIKIIAVFCHRSQVGSRRRS